MKPSDYIRKKREEKFKEDSKPVDAAPLIKGIMDLAKENPAQAREMLDTVIDSYGKGGNMFLDRAFQDGILNEKKLKEFPEMKASDWCPILQGYYNKKDGYIQKDEKVCILSVEGSPIYKNKEKLKKMFKIEIFLPHQVEELIEKERKK